MLKKGFILIMLFILFSACAITSPAEIFSVTPTICTECVQATICAENASGDACIIDTPSIPVNGSPTFVVGMVEPTNTSDATATLAVDFVEPTVAIMATSEKPSVPATLVNTSAPDPRITNTGVVPDFPTKTMTATPGNWLYKPQTGSPKYTKNFAHPDYACEWSGIAGQVFGADGEPQTDIVVVVKGDSNGTPIDLLGFTGASVAYGKGAYEAEFPIGPVRTYDSINIQLFNLDGKPLSAAISFDTFADCDKNLIVMNFVSVK